MVTDASVIKVASFNMKYDSPLASINTAGLIAVRALLS